MLFSSTILQPRKDNLPLVMSILDSSSPRRSILDVSTQGIKFIECHHGFENTICLCTKGEWLLMLQEGTDTRPQHGSNFYLLNPVSRVRLDLPSVGELGYGIATFSIVSGRPDRVAYIVEESCVALHVARPGDPTWEVHYIATDDRVASIFDVVFVGSKVLCVDSECAMIVFDLLSRSLEFVVGLDNAPDACGFIVESKGKIFKVYCLYPLFSSFMFAKLDLQRMRWVEMNGFELENTSWFLGPPSSFCARGKGKKVYTLIPNTYGRPGLPDFETAKLKMVARRKELDESNVYIHDLVEGTVQTLLANSLPGEETFWVDASLWTPH